MEAFLSIVLFAAFLYGLWYYVIQPRREEKDGEDTGGEDTGGDIRVPRPGRGEKK